MIRRPAAVPAAERDAGELRAGVNGERARAGCAGVQRGDDAERGRHVERLRDSHHESPEKQRADGAAHSGGERCEAPERQAGEDEAIARVEIGEAAGEGHGDRIHPEKNGADQAELDVGEVEFVFENREEGEDYLAIDVVDDVGEPEQTDGQPGEARRDRGHGICTISFEESSRRDAEDAEKDLDLSVGKTVTGSGVHGECAGLVGVVG